MDSSEKILQFLSLLHTVSCGFSDLDTTGDSHPVGMEAGLYCSQLPVWDKMLSLCTDLCTVEENSLEMAWVSLLS